ncbi:MAG TPA: cell division protein FtsA [Candidatus Pacearchaeota archaeon]|nr:cell division protein FtsA [Candidatus Pacearchaeota archaeon]HPR79887.1 cell division protein FtsA [Candidatus Pacearchaeota archaeon]
MSRKKIITGLDIGTNTIKILGVKKDSESEPEVLFFEKIDSFGVQKGRVKDSNEVAKRVAELIEKVERKHNCRIDNIFVNINGTKLQLVPSHALVSVGRADQKVSLEDIERINDEVKMINLQSSNKTILEVFPREWILDGEKEIRNPLGLQGVRLELDALLLSSFNSDIEGIIDSVEAVDLEDENIIPGLIADANAVLTPNQKELGVALINIGAGTSGVAVFEEDRLLNMTVFPIGSANITNDIAIGFKTEIEIAERIKKQYGSCLSSDVKKKIDFNLSANDEEEDDEEDILGKKKKVVKKKPKNVLSFSEKELSKIIEARVSEIFELADKEIKKVSKQGLLPGGIVLTGGGSKLPGIVDLAKKEFKLPCRIGYCNSLKGLEKDSSLSTVCGLVISKIDKEVSHSGGGGIGKKIKGFFENFIP